MVANSCEPFTASVLSALRRPAATLVMVRLISSLPTLTVASGAPPAKVYSLPAMVVPVVATATSVVENAPSATSPSLLAFEPAPRARLASPSA
ncbi:hypothetical protein D3C78_1421860 [compost metagenome]